ncbi:MAG: hypothetical protein ONB23_05950 [candidate division KSB1 bacterium]|nr:hypothetical protein [candidate division KSB1 bacterium]
MRIEADPSFPLLREYRAQRVTPSGGQIEGVEYVRSPQNAAPARTVQLPGEENPAEENPAELGRLLSDEEENLIYQLFPDPGPDWGIKAYRAAKAGSEPQPSSSRSRLDLVG